MSMHMLSPPMPPLSLVLLQALLAVQAAAVIEDAALSSAVLAPGDCEKLANLQIDEATILGCVTDPVEQARANLPMQYPPRSVGIA